MKYNLNTMEIKREKGKAIKVVSSSCYGIMFLINEKEKKEFKNENLQKKCL